MDFLVSASMPFVAYRDAYKRMTAATQKPMPIAIIAEPYAALPSIIFKTPTTTDRGALTTAAKVHAQSEITAAQSEAAMLITATMSTASIGSHTGEPSISNSIFIILPSEEATYGTGGLLSELCCKFRRFRARYQQAL